jgi:hypothetical protein
MCTLRNRTLYSGGRNIRHNGTGCSYGGSAVIYRKVMHKFKVLVDEREILDQSCNFVKNERV